MEEKKAQDSIVRMSYRFSEVMLFLSRVRGGFCVLLRFSG